MSHFQLKPWVRIRAIKDDAVIHRYLQAVGRRTHFYFRARMEASNGGATYTSELRTIRGRVVPIGPRARPHRASAPGDFPARDSGRLIGSIRSIVRPMEVEIGTGMFYAKFLKNGTRRMAKRKMSKEALLETLPKVRGELRGFARWRRG